MGVASSWVRRTVWGGALAGAVGAAIGCSDAAVTGLGEPQPLDAGESRADAEIMPPIPDLSVPDLSFQFPLEILTAELPFGDQAETYRVELTAQGGTERGYRWSRVLGQLPSGLFLESDGTPSTILSGRPQAAGTFAFTIQVQDDAGERAQRGFSIEVVAEALPMRLPERMLPPACEAQPFDLLITALNPGPDLRWGIREGLLPTGLVMDPEGTPSTRVTGIPTQLGNFSFIVRVEDATGQSAEATYFMTVEDCDPPLSLFDATLANGNQGSAYRAELTAFGGRPPIQWRLVMGDLPPGLTLQAQGNPAAISGVPTRSGYYTFQVQATDARGNRDEEFFDIFIRP